MMFPAMPWIAKAPVFFISPCPGSQRAPDRFGYTDFYGWAEDKARQAASPEGAAFPVYLRAHGFTLD